MEAIKVGADAATPNDGTAVPTKRRRRHTRERVLAAAERVFAARGFHAASMQEIATEAGFTTGALYSSFNGKDDLFLEVVHQRRAARERVWREALEAAALDSPEGALAMGASVVPDPGWYGAMLEFMVHAARNPARQHAVRDISGFASREAFFIDALKDVSSSVLPVERLAQVVRALVLGFGEMWFAEPERADPTLFADAIAALTGTFNTEQTASTRTKRSSLAEPSTRRAKGATKSPRKERR
jgi:AcrR family transcriptional regulator